MQTTIKIKAEKKSEFYQIKETRSGKRLSGREIKLSDGLRWDCSRRLAKSVGKLTHKLRGPEASDPLAIPTRISSKSNVQNQAIKCDGLRPPMKVKVLYESLSHGEDFVMLTGLGFGFGFVTDWLSQRWYEGSVARWRNVNWHNDLG